MNCQNSISYLIKPGDTLYKIATLYDTTVENILISNPHLNIYNLRIGELITFCIDKNMSMQSIMFENDGLIPNTGNDNDYDDEYVITLPELDLNNDIRMFCSQHCIWTRMLIISIIDNLSDLNAVSMRLLRIAKDIAGLYRNYYGSASAINIERTITNHLSITSNFIKAIKDNDTNTMNEENNRWFANADELANLLSGINPFYSFEEMQTMFHNQLELLKQQVNMRMEGNHTDELSVYDNVEKQALIVADMLTNGMVNQFPDAFF